MKSVSKGENRCSCNGKNYIKSYCQQCNVYICFDCNVKQHYDHNKVIDLTEKCCRYLADYQKLNMNITLMNDSKEKHIKKELLDSIVNELKGNFTGTKKSLKQNTNDSSQAIYKDFLAKEMVAKRAEKVKKDTVVLTQMKGEVSKICKTLRKCLAENKYESVDKLITEESLKDCEERTKKLSSDINEDISFLSELQKLKQPKVSYSYNPMSIIKINTLISKPNRLVQFDCNKGIALIYNIDTQKTLVRTINHKLPFRFVIIQANSNIYLSGGDNNQGHFLKSLHFYDEVGGELVEREGMKIGRSRHALVEIDGKLIYAIGGETESGITNTCEVYDIENNSWKTAPKLNEARCNLSACYALGKVYAIAGWNKYTLDSIETFKQDSWVQIKLNKVGLQCAGAVMKSSGQILIFGGYKEGEVLSKEVFTFDLTTHKIKRIKDLKEEDAFVSSEVQIVEGQVYGFGYTKGNIHVYNESKDEWKWLAYKEYMRR